MARAIYEYTTDKMSNPRCRVIVERFLAEACNGMYKMCPNGPKIFGELCDENNNGRYEGDPTPSSDEHAVYVVDALQNMLMARQALHDDADSGEDVDEGEGEEGRG